MHPALLKLVKLNAHARWRQTVRGLKTPKGAIFFAVAILWFLLIIIPNLLVAFKVNRTDTEMVRVIIPWGLFLLCLINLISSMWEKSLQFKLSEIDFLFPGPFTRREILIYKIANSLNGTLFMSLIFSLIFLRHTTFWLAGFTGIFFTLMFIQLFSMAVILVKQTIAEHAYNTFRKVIVVVIVALIAYGAGDRLIEGIRQDPINTLKSIQDSWSIYILLLPFKAFSYAITATTLIELAQWLSIALIIDLSILSLVIMIDANFLEVSIKVSQKQYQRIKQAQRGQVWSGFGRKQTSKLHIPQFPWMGGTGPIAWRQTMHVLRNSGSFLFFLFFILVMIGPMLFMDGDKDSNLIYPFLGMLAWITFIFTMSIPFGFRGDLEHMDWFKMLPISSRSVAVGEIIGNILFISLLQIILFIAFAIYQPDSILILVIAAFFTVPFNGMLVSMDNLLFLLFPIRVSQSTPGDFQNFGKQMIFFLLKMATLIVGLGIAVGLGLLIYWLTNYLMTLLLITTWIILMLEVTYIVEMVTWAYKKFDPSLDTPA